MSLCPSSRTIPPFEAGLRRRGPAGAAMGTHRPAARGRRLALVLRRPRLAVLVLALALVVLAPAGWAAFLGVSGNMHAVLQGELYRSGRLSPEALAAFVRHAGIRSIVNLEGARPDKNWYRREIAVAETLGVRHVDLRWSASRALDAAEIRAYLDLMRTLPKPVLVHCRAGADRTGLAASLYLAHVDGRDRTEAGRQLSFRYGHVGLPLSEAWPMDETFAAAEGLIEVAESR